MKKTSQSINGTSFHGITIRATRQELIDALGDPHYTDSADEKTQYEWHFETDDGQVFTIYDWKEHYNHDANVELIWHIGGHSWMSTATAKEEIGNALACATEALAIGENTYVEDADDPETRHWKGYTSYLERNAASDDDGSYDSDY